MTAFGSVVIYEVTKLDVIEWRYRVQLGGWLTCYFPNNNFFVKVAFTVYLKLEVFLRIMR